MADFILVPLFSGPILPGERVQFALQTSSDFPEYYGVQFSLTYDADVLTYEGTVFEPPINIFSNNPGEPAGASEETTITGIEGSTLEANGTLVGASRAAVLEFTAKSAADDSAITITPTFALFSDENATLDQIGAPPPVLLDVEPLPTVELSASPLAGVEADGTVITLTATASEAVDGDQTVALSLTGDAIAADFGGVLPTEITILDGQTTGSVTVTVADDTEIEPDETATFTISSPSAGIELGTTTGASVTLESEDVPPPINASFTLVPLNTGPVAPGDTVQFALETSSDFPEYYGVQFSLTYDADVLTYEGTVFEPPINIFSNNPGEPAGASEETTITGIEGSTLEANGTLVGASRAAVLEFTAKSAADDSAITITPTFALFSDENATLDQIGAPPPVLLDVEPLPTVELSASPLAGVEADGTVITLTATASEAVDGDQTVALSLTGDAIAADFGGVLPTEITILDGQTTGSVTVTVADDTEIEPDETATFTISSPSAGIELGTTTGASVTLESEDRATGSVTLVPTPGPYQKGQTITVEIVTSSDFPAIIGFEGNLEYDLDVLSLVSVDYLDDFDVTAEVSEPAGESGTTLVGPISGVESANPSEISGSVIVATLNFEVKSLDEIMINLLPLDGRLFIDDNNLDIELTAPVTLELDLNLDPVAAVDSATVQEDGSVEINVLGNDSDPNGETPTILDFSNGTNGTVTATAGGLTYAPNPNFNGTDSFTYTIEDAQGATDTATVTVTVANVNDDPTGAVLITGTAEEDAVLTASNTLADEDGLSGPISYQWFADGTAIAGAVGATLSLTQAEVAAVITVEASYTDDFGEDESVLSAPTDAVANVNDDPTGAVLITGTAEEDAVLTASNTLADEDGLSGPISYQWFADGTAIAGAVGATLSLTQAEVAAVITVEASYTDDFGEDESVLSAPTDAVANVNDDPTGAVLITGTAEEDAVLTASNTLADEDGLSGPISYQWFADGTAIAGAVGATLSLTQAEVAAVITVEASYTDDFGEDESVLSAPTDAVTNVNDDPTGAVLIDGTVEEGQELTANISGLADEDGLGAFSYQWFANGTAIAGATGATLTLTQAEVGAAITVAASYTDDFGEDESVLSAPTDPVTDSNEPPVAEDDSATVDEDGSVIIDVLVNDSDPDGGAPEPDEVLYRVNVGGAELTVTDGLDWGGDTGNFGTAGNSPYLVANSTGGSTFNSSSGSSHDGTASATDPSIPAGTPADIFQTERYDLGSDPEMQWKFPVQTDFGLVAGDEVIVRLYFAELFDQIDATGERVFDVSVEGAVPTAFDDIDPYAIAGANAGFMLDTVATIDGDGELDLEFIHGIEENPALKGIEILRAGTPTAGTENLTVAIGTGPSNGSVAVNPDGTVTYTPNADYNGSDSFIYQITDADGATDTATVGVEVEPVNDPPELTVGDEFDFLDSASGPVFTASATDVDVGDTLTFSLGGTDAGFFDIDETSGAVTLSATAPPEFTIADGDIGSIADVTQNLDLIVSVSDGTETVDQAVTVNFLKDTDGDGFADANDNALFVANPDQRDTDGDGYGNIIDADLNNDGVVLVNDVFLFRAAFNLSSLTDGVDVEANADFTGDGAVNGADVAIFRDLYGQDIETQSLIGDDYSTVA